jgi:hypothetical protein
MVHHRLREQIDELRSEAADLRQRLFDLQTDLLLACPHEHTVEADYVPDPYGHHPDPPFRVCRVCGFSERGWGCGYQVLTRPAVPVSREDAYAIRTTTFPNSTFVKGGWTVRELYEKAIRERRFR